MRFFGTFDTVVESVELRENSCRRIAWYWVDF